MDRKTKTRVIIILFTAVIIVSLFFAYQNGAIGKAVIKTLAG